MPISFNQFILFKALTLAAEIELIKDLYLGTYEISDLKVTENGDNLHLTYLISVKKKIEDKQLSSKPAPRISVWQKNNGKWQWIAHANLKEIPAGKLKVSGKFF